MIIHKYSIHIGYMWSKDHQPIGCVALLLVYLKNSWWAVITEIPFKGVIFHSPLKKTRESKPLFRISLDHTSFLRGQNGIVLSSTEQPSIFFFQNMIVLSKVAMVMCILEGVLMVVVKRNAQYFDPKITAHSGRSQHIKQNMNNSVPYST